MDINSQLQLSFYKKIKPIRNKDNVFLVSHVETGTLFVMKTYTDYNVEVFRRLQALRLSGIPEYILIAEDEETHTLTVIEEYINGTDLETLMNLRENPFPPEISAEIISEICSITGQLHLEYPPIIHRDIKPANIIIDTHGKIYLTDFNISRNVDETKTTDTTIFGTKGYAAPEQYGFMQCTQQSDIYSIGVLFKYLMTGTSENPREYTGLFSDIIMTATAMDPSQRYKTVYDMAISVKRTMTEQDKASFKTAPGKPAPVRSHKNKENKIPVSISEIRRKLKEPLKMPVVHKLLFLFSFIFIGYEFIPESAEVTTTPFSFCLAVITFSSVIVMPFFYCYYVIRKRIRLSRNSIINFVLHTAVLVTFLAVFLISTALAAEIAESV